MTLMSVPSREGVVSQRKVVAVTASALVKE